MSFKLFFASTLGLIKSTRKIEATHQALLADYIMFCDFEKSPELSEYLELEILVNSATFKQTKKELRQLSYKGSKEEGQSKELKRLERKSNLKKFYLTLKSEELKRFGKVEESGIIEKYRTLKKYVESSEFQFEKTNAAARGKKKFETTEAFAKYNEFKQLQSSFDLKFYQNFKKSSDFRNYEIMSVSPEKKRFEELHKIYSSITKAEKDSKEASQLAEYKKLTKNRKLQRFFKTEKSDELIRFNKIAASGLFEKFQILKKFVESPEFKQQKLKAIADGKREFETTGAYAKLQEYNKLQNSEDVKFYLKFEKSPGRINYEKMKNSDEKNRFEELQTITASDDFIKRVAYLEDKNKWEKTEESIKEKRFAEYQKIPQLINYLKYKNSNAFDFLKKWDLVFEDNFDSGNLDQKKWVTRSHWANQLLGQNFSQVGDLHAFTDGKNVTVGGKSLKLEVRKEKVAGMQWQIPFGFVEKEFDYSSGIVSTSGIDWWNHGILEAKVKYSPTKHFVDAIYLLGEESSPQINLVEMGAKNRLGTLIQMNGEVKADCESISGLKSGEFYIFRLEWTSNSLTWKINEKEILTIPLHVPSHSMHLNAASIVVNEPNNDLPHRFEIEWIRFYQPHKV